MTTSPSSTQPDQTLVGTRLRRSRQELGLTTAEVATLTAVALPRGNESPRYTYGTPYGASLHQWSPNGGLKM